MQDASGGLSGSDIQRGALAAADPSNGLEWLDIGCGTGEILRVVRCLHAPQRLVATDIISWLADDLHDSVEMFTGSAEEVLLGLEPVDRVLMVEVMEHLESPWTVLRAAARLVRPGGRLVISTPNVASLRHRLELLARGQLTSFRPTNQPHLTPILPHVVAHILGEEGMQMSTGYCGIDLVPLTGGGRWPATARRWAPRLTHRSALMTATRDARR
jgi:2-polyprenyl-3-methyl-5-hydroxy-6-metoxy-1,4-benzoquinol methylase